MEERNGATMGIGEVIARGVRKEGQHITAEIIHGMVRDTKAYLNIQLSPSGQIVLKK